MRRLSVIIIVLIICMISIPAHSVLAATPEQQKAYESFKAVASILAQYVASTPTKKSGPLPGGSELASLALSGPDIVCGISITMVSNARLGAVLRYNEASDAGQYEDLEMLANLLREIEKLHVRLTTACNNYLNPLPELDTSQPGEDSTTADSDDEDDTNYGDLNVVLKKTNAIEEDFSEYKERVKKYLESYGLGDSYLLQASYPNAKFKLNCTEIDTVSKEIRPYIDFLVKKRKELDSSLFAAQNMKIGPTGINAVYNLVSALDNEMSDKIFFLEYLRAKKKELDCSPEKVSCDIESLLERREEFDISGALPSSTYQAFVDSKMNIHCGMWKVVKISTTITSSGESTTDVELDTSGVNVYGIMLDENAKLGEKVVDGGWDNPDFDVYITPEELDRINNAEDPAAAFIAAWGKTIKFKGYNTQTKTRAGILNLAANVKNKVQQAKPVLAWKPVKPVMPRLPSPSTIASPALQISKSALQKIGLLKKPQPDPQKKCTIRGIPYNCYTRTLDVEPESVERGGAVRITGKGFTFSGSVTLLLESVSGGRTLLRVRGKTVGSDTYEINANIPSGQYKVSAIVERGAIDDFADSAETLTVHSGVPSSVPGKLGESCDNRKCSSGLVCGAPYTYGASGMRQAPGYGYTCIETNKFNTLCVGRGNSPPPWHCVT